MRLLRSDDTFWDSYTEVYSRAKYDISLQTVAADAGTSETLLAAGGSQWMKSEDGSLEVLYESQAAECHAQLAHYSRKYPVKNAPPPSDPSKAYK